MLREIRDGAIRRVASELQQCQMDRRPEFPRRPRVRRETLPLLTLCEEAATESAGWAAPFRPTSSDTDGFAVHPGRSREAMTFGLARVPPEDEEAIGCTAIFDHPEFEELESERDKRPRDDALAVGRLVLRLDAFKSEATS